jgi:hypothetical protein
MKGANIYTAIVAVVSLATTLLNRCEATKTDNALKHQFSPAYWQSVKDGEHKK